MEMYGLQERKAPVRLVFVAKDTTNDTVFDDMFTTIRLGEKWSERVSVGSVIEMVVEDEGHPENCSGRCGYVGDAKVLAQWVGPWRMMPPEVILYSTESQASYSDAKDFLEKVYNTDIGEETIVTVLYLSFCKHE